MIILMCVPPSRYLPLALPRFLSIVVIPLLQLGLETCPSHFCISLRHLSIIAASKRVLLASPQPYSSPSFNITLHRIAYMIPNCHHHLLPYKKLGDGSGHGNSTLTLAHARHFPHRLNTFETGKGDKASLESTNRLLHEERKKERETERERERPPESQSHSQSEAYFERIDKQNKEQEI